MYPSNRPASRSRGSPAASSRTNPQRSNNDRQDSYSKSSPLVDHNTAAQRVLADSESDMSGSQSIDDLSATQARTNQRLNQIVQQFFSKGALLVISSRVALSPLITQTGNVKQNRWFNIVLDDSQELFHQTMQWRTLNLDLGLPQDLVIDFYVDLSDLPKGKSCVITDEQGKRWDVSDSIASSRSSSSYSGSGSQQIVLERWHFSMVDGSYADVGTATEILSTLYKKSIPIFRSIWSQSRLLPAYRYSRTIIKHKTTNPTNEPLPLKYRLTSGQPSRALQNALSVPLYAGQTDLMEEFDFGALHSPAGIMHVSVAYRTNGDLSVDDSEALLSSQFMRSGEEYFKPSWTSKADGYQVAGSAPGTQKRFSVTSTEQNPTYGSLNSKLVIAQHLSSSPLNAARATPHSPLSPSSKIPSSLPRADGSRASIRSNDGMPTNQRRPSLSFQPFKKGSLASSPIPNLPNDPTSPIGLPSRAGTSYSHRSRPSMTTLPQAILRTPSLQNEPAVGSSASSSPKPTPIQKFSSSFNYRKSRMSSGASRGEEERSSGKPSPASSIKVGSDIIQDAAGGQTSAESVQQNDDENLKDFLRLLDSKKELKSLSRNDSAARDASTRRTNTALSKYQRMKESNHALSDSISSSVQLQRSSSSSSRQLGNVPPMVAGTSISPGSSLGKPISPHTPHTPAIPSRLSANSIINYSAPQPRRSRSGQSTARADSGTPATVTGAEQVTHAVGSHAIDIPTSPRPWTYGRRSSSVRQQRSIEEEAAFAPRPFSVPIDDRDRDRELSVIEHSINESSGAADQTSSEEKLNDARSGDEPSPASSTAPATRARYSSTVDPSGHTLLHRTSRGSINRRAAPAFGHSYTPSSASASGIGHATASFSERGGGAGRGSPGLRNSSNAQEDEALIFELSDMDGRRSLEDGGAAERGGYRAGRWAR